MSEFADMAIDRGFTELEDLMDYRGGAISDMEAYDRGVIDEMGGEIGNTNYGSYRHRSITCKHCKLTGLHWLNTKDGWRTASNGIVHECPTFRKKI